MKKLVAFFCALWLAFATVSAHSAEKLEITEVYSCEAGDVYAAIIKIVPNEAALIGMGKLNDGIAGQPVLYILVDLKSGAMTVYEKRPGEETKKYPMEEFDKMYPSICLYFDNEKV